MERVTATDLIDSFLTLLDARDRLEAERRELARGRVEWVSNWFEDEVDSAKTRLAETMDRYFGKAEEVQHE